MKIKKKENIFVEKALRFSTRENVGNSSVFQFSTEFSTMCGKLTV